MTTSTKPRVSINMPKWSESTKRDFDSISRRASAFSTKATGELFGKDGNITDPGWARILDDIDAWSKKHKVPLSTREHNRDSGGPTSIGLFNRPECPSRTTYTETIEFWGSGQRVKVKHTCYLRRQTLLGNCVYSCSSEQL